jgi:hypothetical protein
MSPTRTLALLTALVCAVPARADDVAEARALYRDGTQLYKAGRYREAVAAFEAAYRKKPHGAIHYNLAQCREKLGEWPAALRGYHDYLRELPDATDRPAVLAAIQQIESKLAETGVQVLLVYSDPLGAEVRIDGRARGTTPFHSVLPPGSYSVALSREGYALVSREVVLGPRGSMVMDEKLRPASAVQVPLPPPPVASSPSAAGAAPDLAARPPSAAPVRMPAPPAKPAAHGRRLWTWVAAGASVAALGAAGYYGMQAQKKSDDLRDGTVRPGGAAESLAKDAESSVRNSRILYGVAAAAGAAGVTLFFVEGKF